MHLLHGVQPEARSSPRWYVGDELGVVDEGAPHGDELEALGMARIEVLHRGDAAEEDERDVDSGADLLRRLEEEHLLELVLLDEGRPEEREEELLQRLLSTSIISLSGRSPRRRNRALSAHEAAAQLEGIDAGSEELRGLDRLVDRETARDSVGEVGLGDDGEVGAHLFLDPFQDSRGAEPIHEAPP